RGPLPALVLTRRTPSTRRALARLFTACVGEGLLVGMTTGAIVGGTVALPLGPLAPLGAAYGLAIGAIVAIPLSLIIGAAVMSTAAMKHTPLRDPRGFHRDIWKDFLLS